LALDQTFSFRRTHTLPTTVPTPPPSWAKPYAAMARTDKLAWTTLGDVTTAVQSFLDPVLTGSLDASWNPLSWKWSW
jgi:hypothetical protein